LDLNELKEKVLELYHSQENKKRLNKWIPQEDPWWDLARDQLHCSPRPISELHGQVPMTVYMLNSVWSHKLRFSLERFYKDPEEYLKEYLRIKIEKFKIPDDTPIDNRIRIWFGAVLGASLFEVPIKYYEHADPILMLANNTLIEEPGQLNNLKRPNFYQSGLMPKAIEFYEKISEMVGKDFKVLFPLFFRSPFGIAIYLRGFENLLIDFKLNPDFVKDLLDFIADVRIDWYKELEKYLGFPILKGDLFNDEIQCDMINPEDYKRLILFSEEKLDRFNGGIAYWHSCGQIHPIIKDILNNLHVDLMDIGPANDKKHALESVRDIQPQPGLEIRFDQLKYIQTKNANIDDMKKRIRYVYNLCKANNLKAFQFKAGGLQVLTSIEDLWRQVFLWIKAVRDINSEMNMQK
jgi:hypothetical protein